MDIRNLHPENYEDLYRHLQWQISSHFNIGSAICDVHVGKNGGKIAIFNEDEDGNHFNWTFSDLANRSNQVARFLDDLNVAVGDRVAVCLSPRAELVAVLAGIYKKGCIALSISTLLGDDAVLYRLRHCEAKAIFMEGKRRELREAATGLQTLQQVIVLDEGISNKKERSFDEVEKSSTRFQCVDTLADAPAQLFYTSGTTGPPKGTLHAHRYLLGHIPSFQMYFELAPEEGDVYWTPADSGWIGALADVILPGLYFGKPVVVNKRSGRFEPRNGLEIMQKYGVTCSFIPPTALRLLKNAVEHPLKEYSLKLRAIASAGESVGADIVKWGKNELGIPVNEFYGCTEFNLVLVNNSRLIGPRPGSMGKPCPGHVVEVIDEEGRILPPGEIGEIAMKSPDPIMFLGYWNNPEATSKKFKGAWFLSGDLGYKDIDGYLWFKGRNDDLIKSSGYRIGPEEVEHIINMHPAVLESAVIAKPDVVRGSIVKSYIVLKEGFSSSDELKIRIQELVKKELAAYAYPREIEFISEIPRTVTSKLKRYELRNRSNTE